MAPNFSFCLAALLALAALPRTLSLAPPRTAPPARASGRTALRAVASRPKWRQKKTLADEVGQQFALRRWTTQDGSRQRTKLMASEPVTAH